MKAVDRHLIINLLLLLSFLLNLTDTNAQFYDNGQDRFRRLSHIKTDHFDVIFPTSETALGQLYANHLEEIYKTGGQTLAWQPRRIPVVLRTSVAYANGEVVWAPRRMNLFTTATPDNYFQRWDEHLTMHEFRHVVQTDKLNQGTSQFFYHLFGEQYFGLLLGVHVPYWFLEGDAVAYETGASAAGRGRIADFEHELAAQVSQKGIWHYHKAIFGSYADYVPSRYQLGYHLISYGRLNYGTEIWQNALNQVANHPITMRPFGKGIKMTTGLREPEFYYKALEPLQQKIVAEPDNSTLITNCNSTNYTIFYNPQYANNKIIAYRENLSDISAFVSIDNKGKQHIIKHIGTMAVEHFSTNEKMIVWNQIRSTRWNLFNHSQIKTYDIKNKNTKTIARRGRYHCSTLSHNGLLIASACYADTTHWSITIHNTKGRLMQQIALNDALPTRIAWSDNDQQIAIIVNYNNSKSILIFDLDTHKNDTIISNIFDDISNLLFANNTIYFTGNYDGQTAWYSYNLNTRDCNIIATSGFGTGSGSIYGDTLLFTYYTADGYMIAQKNIADSRKKASLPTTRETAFTQKLAQQEQQVKFSSDSIFNVKYYSRLLHLLNIHSWGPLSVRIDESEIGPGFTFMSQDALSTSFLTAGYQYYFADDIDNLFVEYQYKGFYPIFGLRGDLKYYDQKLNDNRGRTYTFNCKQRDLTASVRLPAILSSGAFTTSAYIQTAYQLRKRTIEQKTTNYQSDTLHQTLVHSAYFQCLRRQAVRDIQPRWGFYIHANYMHYINSDNTDYQASIQGKIYLPGLLQNHGISVSGGLQKRSKYDLIFSNIVAYPRGYKSVSNTEFSSLLTSYTMPICYPDLPIGNALYIKRIRTTIFYDYAQAKLNSKYNFQSVGADVIADFNIFRIAIPFNIGLRYARCITTSSNYFSPIFTMNFSF